MSCDRNHGTGGGRIARQTAGWLDYLFVSEIRNVRLVPLVNIYSPSYRPHLDSKRSPVDKKVFDRTVIYGKMATLIRTIQ
jgi:hypothetical protein